MPDILNTEKMLEETLINNLGKNNIINIDSINRLFELKLLEIESIIEIKKQEAISIRKRDILQSQLFIMEDARKTISLLTNLPNTPIIFNILEDCYKILANITEIGKEEFSSPILENQENPEELIHLTSKDIKNSLSQTKILDVMRTAKKNGWDLRIIDGKLFVYKNGKKVSGKEDIFIPCNEVISLTKKVKQMKQTKQIKQTKFDKLRKLLDK